jgi:hypothetical protein
MQEKPRFWLLLALAASLVSTAAIAQSHKKDQRPGNNETTQQGGPGNPGTGTGGGQGGGAGTGAGNAGTGTGGAAGAGGTGGAGGGLAVCGRLGK